VSQLVALRTAIASTLDADTRLDGVNIYVHGGDFDLSQLATYDRKPPAAILSLIQAKVHVEGGLPVAEVLCHLTIVSNDRAGVRRDVMALRIVDACLNILQRHPNQHWGLEDEVQGPTDIGAMNYYSKKWDAENYAVWGIAWKQCIELKPTDAALEAEVDFETFHANWDIAPRDNAATIAEPADPQPDDAVIDAEDEVDIDQD
jgi:hypothetical protein